MTQPAPFDHLLKSTLAALRADLAPCDLVAFCDLKAQLVLRHAAENFVPQEQLDQLSAQAAHSFLILQVAQDNFERGKTDLPASSDVPYTVLVLEPDGSLLSFTKSHRSADDALLCRTRKGMNAATLQSRAETAMAQLAAAQA